MNKMAILAVVGASICASGVKAADVSIKGSASETLQASDNYFLLNKPSGPLTASTTAGTLDFLAQTPTTNYLLNTNFSYYKYFGPGTADTAMTWGTPAHATFSIDHTEQLTKYNFAASWDRADAATTQLAQTGIASGKGTINTFSLNGGLTHDLSRIDTISLATQASKVEFTDPAQFPYIDVTTTATWKHDITQTTTLNNFVSFDWFSEDDPAQSQRLFWKFMTGLELKIIATPDFHWTCGNRLRQFLSNRQRATEYSYRSTRHCAISARERSRQQHPGGCCANISII